MVNIERCDPITDAIEEAIRLLEGAHRHDQGRPALEARYVLQDALNQHRGAIEENERLREAGNALADAVSDIMADDSESVFHTWVRRWREATGPCPACGGRGWHAAGGNDPMECGRCAR